MTVVTRNGDGPLLDAWGSTICDQKVAFIEQWIEFWRAGPVAGPWRTDVGKTAVSTSQARMGPKTTTGGSRGQRNVFYCGRVTTNAATGQACAGVYGV